MTPRSLALMLVVSTDLLVVTGCRKQPAVAGGADTARGGPLQVIAVPARQQPVSETVGLVGSITPNEWVEVKSETDGTVQEVGFMEGQRVEKGQLLVALDQTKLQAGLAQAEANFQLAKSTYDRAERLHGEKLVPQQDYDQAVSGLAANQATVDLTRRNLKDARLVAPFSGITGARLISPGQVIARNTTLTSVVDLDTVKIELNVPERYLSQIQNGQKLTFSVAAYPGQSFQGEVYFISPQLEISTRTALVKARVPNPDIKLRGGMFARLDLTLRLRDSALVIPEPALLHSGDSVLVYVIDGQGLVQIRPVKIGLRLAGKAEVIEGLNAGEQVIVEGIQKIAPGMPVKNAPPEKAAPYN